jgi:hypothetical protein
MKRLWLFLLSLTFVLAFSVQAFAVDVKFNGEMYVGGIYLDQATLQNKDTATVGPSTAFYYQRLRLGTEFVVSPGVSVVTRADIMERVLGGARSAPGAGGATANDVDSNATRAENENIGFDMAYIKAVTPIGQISAGYIPFGSWGTVFNNSGPKGVPGMNLAIPVGNFVLLGWIFKPGEQLSVSPVTGARAADLDYDLYLLGAIYRGKGIEAGILLGYARQATYRSLLGFKREAYSATPYFKATFGPVYLEGELNTGFGKDRTYDSGAAGSDRNISPLQAYLSGTVTLGPAYVGGTFAYWAGDDPSDAFATKYDGLFLGGEWSPTLIMWNRDRAYNIGNLSGYNAANKATATAGGLTNDGNGFSAAFQNAYFWQVRAGVKPTDKLDIGASLSKSYADQDPTIGWVSKDMGWEVDVTGTYKITNNLSYLLGVGYVLTGDYFKGINNSNRVSNDYLVINKLTLTF